MTILELALSTRDVVDVTQFSLRESVSSLFEVEVIVVSRNQSIDLDAAVGQPCRFTLRSAVEGSAPVVRFWDGICSALEQVRSVTRAIDKLATYQMTLVPHLWLATQRRNHRVFQQMSEVEIAIAVLAEWGVEPILRLDPAQYKKRKYRVQYAETDYAFIARMLEEAGVAHLFVQGAERTELVLTDRPQVAAPRKARLPFRDDPSSLDAQDPSIYHAQVGRRVRPGRYTMRDHDPRMAADYRLLASSPGDDATDAEVSLESYHYTPGAFLYEVDRGDDTPVADDKSKVRSDEKEAAQLAKKRMDAARTTAHLVAFDSNAVDLAAGVVVGFVDHPHHSLGDDQLILLLEVRMSGFDTGNIQLSCQGLNAKFAYRPPMTTPRPRVQGIESATVVGPPGEEIHVDEFGRVRIHFHWDRRTTMDDSSSCWIPVSQGWAGTGFGSIALPRVGQEVLVDFLGGDPDRPVITGRVFTNVEKVPYTLPGHKTITVVTKTSSTGGTGGYNEIKAEDKAGRELLSVRAERDMETLVKREERRTVGEDQIEKVGRTRTSSVGNTWVFQALPPPGREKPWPSGLTWDNDKLEIKIGGSTITVLPDSIMMKSDTIDIDGITVASLTSSAGTTNVYAKAKVYVNSSGDDIVVNTPAFIKLNCD